MGYANQPTASFRCPGAFILPYLVSRSFRGTVCPDPAGPVDGPNLYWFVRGNPVNLKDKNGKWSDPTDPSPERSGEALILNYCDPEEQVCSTNLCSTPDTPAETSLWPAQTSDKTLEIMNLMPDWFQKQAAASATVFAQSPIHDSDLSAATDPKKDYVLVFPPDNLIYNFNFDQYDCEKQLSEKPEVLLSPSLPANILHEYAHRWAKYGENDNTNIRSLSRREKSYVSHIYNRCLAADTEYMRNRTNLVDIEKRKIAAVIKSLDPRSEDGMKQLANYKRMLENLDNYLIQESIAETLAAYFLGRLTPTQNRAIEHYLQQNR